MRRTVKTTGEKQSTFKQQHQSLFIGKKPITTELNAISCDWVRDRSRSEAFTETRDNIKQEKKRKKGNLKSNHLQFVQLNRILMQT